MRTHIHFGHGRYVHKRHIQHALHFNRPIHTLSHGTVAIKKDIGSFRPSTGEGLRKSKKLKPLRFKF